MSGRFSPRVLISSFKLFEYCKARYPNRTVEASAYCNHDDFYYFNRLGQVRMVRNKNEIWHLDEEAGFPFIKNVRIYRLRVEL